jgi:hypothetical protein
MVTIECTTMSIDIGGYTVQPATADIHRRMTLLIWGKSGSGKSTLASTAPGTRKMWINFDANGPASLAGYEDVDILDLSGAPDKVAEDFKTENSMFRRSFEKQLADHPEWECVVFDSLTTFADKALKHGVVCAAKIAKGGDRPTIEAPGLSGYAHKYVWMRAVIEYMLEVTSRYNRHLIFIAHEDTPNKNREGAVISIDIMIGSNLSQSAPINIGEVWHITDLGDKQPRVIAVRPCRLCTPMKTLMFSATTSEFPWRYNPDTRTPGINDWYTAWVKNGYKKVPLPT